MQTFMPYPNITQSLACLDYKRLGKQRVEGMQIYKMNMYPSSCRSPWSNHPATLMWKGYDHFLSMYINTAIFLWKSRGFNNTMELIFDNSKLIIPPWFGNKKFHDSHKSNLLRKFPEHYKIHFSGVKDNLPYIWPTKEM